MKPKQYKNYIAGIYLRLSRDDERAGESLSIENQKILVTKYAKEKGWEIKDVYVDDGYSGTNFEHPGVKRLLDDAKAGEINTIVVKDLSRFGRNYILVGQVYRLCVSVVRNTICRDRGQNRHCEQRYVGNGYDADYERF